MPKEWSSSAMAATAIKAAVTSAVPAANPTTRLVIFLLTFSLPFRYASSVPKYTRAGGYQATELRARAG